MQTSLRNDSAGAAGRVRRWVLGLLATLLLLGCCFWGGLFWYLPVLPQLWANHLDHVQGKAELLVPAQWNSGMARLSPDGRRLLLAWGKNGPTEIVAWDLVTGQYQAQARELSTFRWLNADQFAIFEATDKFYVGDARDGTIQRITQVQTLSHNAPAMLNQALAQWRAADEVYALFVFGGGGYAILTQHHEQFRLYRMDVPDEQVRMVLADLAHTEVPIYGWHTSVGSLEHPQWFSPNGQLYATRKGSGGDVRVQIYNRAGEQIAEAYKGGWVPAVLGWAHDSSGIYVQWEISGSTAVVLVPYKSLFKLSPLTPEEERWEIVKRIGGWAVGGAMVVGLGWWLWRRWHRPNRAAS